ncbi:MAG: flagellar M-ring protein FliF [Desulfobacterales bacterium]|nr:flagellar M-ring protein FliF [Desulfobacterales bacterium]
MNPIIEQFVNIYKNIPTSKKIAIISVVVVLIAGFAWMFMVASKVDYQTLYGGLSPEDAGQIVEKLKESKIPYEVGGGGSLISVPSDRLYETRMALATAGLPQGKHVGFEIFDKTDFGTTEFVQKLNYQRALQGELSRTIKEFKEIEDARVMIVLSKESVFIEESKPPSASVLLKLRTKLAKDKVNAVVFLVSNSVEGLSPDMVTVVDTDGNILSKGSPDEADSFANAQLDYKLNFEQTMSRRIQSMLEKVVGPGKAIVRITADMNFDQIDTNEEIYDPDAQVVRSKQNVIENFDKKNSPVANVSSVNPIAQPSGANENTEKNQVQNEIINYEISKTIRKTSKPVAEIKRLSVSAVIDGTYKTETDENGNQVRKFVARSQNDMDQFKKIVQVAMGYNADREDQITVESFPFSYMDDMEMLTPAGIDWVALKREYGRTMITLFVILLLFLFIIKPLMKSVQEIKSSVEPMLLPTGYEDRERPEFDSTETPPKVEMTVKQKAIALANEDIEKTVNIIKTWLK